MKKQIEFITTRFHRETVSGPYVYKLSVALASDFIPLAEFTGKDMDHLSEVFTVGYAKMTGDNDALTTYVDQFPPLSTD